MKMNNKQIQSLDKETILEMLNPVEILQLARHYNRKKDKTGQKYNWKYGKDKNIIESDEFEIKELIGKGFWGEIYKAYDNKNKKDVAIKIYKLSKTAEKQLKERDLHISHVFEKEMQVPPSENIVQRKVGKDNKNRLFLITPLYKETLSDKLRENEGLENRFSYKKGLSMDMIIKYSKDILNALIDMQKHNEVHNDLKPDNIMIDKEGNLLLNDFGTSSYEGWLSSLDKRDHMGCVYIRSPQLFMQGKHPYKSSDIYSFGSLLYRMFTGKYILEDEINKALESKPIDGLDKFMKSLDYNKFKGKIDEKVAEREIPQNFKDFIKKCVLESQYSWDSNYSDAKLIKQEFEECVKMYNKKTARKNLFKKLVNTFKIPKVKYKFNEVYCK